MLPDSYKKEMKEMLKEEYAKYIDSFNYPSYKSLRVNTTKISVDEFLNQFPYKLEPIEWTKDGFYFEDEEVYKHPYYYAGLYYIQEASAMLPAEVLPIEENDIVLDACAAPGGKSLKLLNKLNSTGILIANDISVSRAKALLRNIERQGFDNFYVFAEDVKKLSEKYKNCFNAILLDAPCSGEGMFRKDHSLINSWLKNGSEYYSEIQKELIICCLNMLKNGGKLVYSTCTFSKCEDEEIVDYAIRKIPDIRVLPIKMCKGFTECENKLGVKLFPHKVKGEGHYVCLLEKGGIKTNNEKAKNQELRIKESLYRVPYFDNVGIRTLRSGLLIGEEKKNAFEYSQAYAMSLKQYDKVINLNMNDVNVTKYLKGETIRVESDIQGDVLVCVNEYPLGFGKLFNHILKNKIDKGWTIR